MAKLAWGGGLSELERTGFFFWSEKGLIDIYTIAKGEQSGALDLFTKHWVSLFMFMEGSLSTRQDTAYRLCGSSPIPPSAYP